MVQKSLILGNGYNHALNLCVDYKDYFGSRNWKSIQRWYKGVKLIDFLSKQVSEEKYSIEDGLEKYLDEACSINAEKDKKAFFALERSFSNFVDKTIRQKTYKDVAQNNKAFAIMSKYQQLRQQSHSENAIFIFSFNYSRYDDIRKKFEKSIFHDSEQGRKDNYRGNPWGGIELNIAYNHGKSSGGKSKAIFGLSLDSFRGSRKNLISKYKFLLKEQHRNYPIENKCYLLNSLFEASSIEFYGFGFTKPDKPYIENWLTTPPEFEGKRSIVLHDLKENKDKIIGNIKKIAQRNWPEFILHYSIKFNDEDGVEEFYAKY